jgi:hypothetical protein
MERRPRIKTAIIAGCAAFAAGALWQGHNRNSDRIVENAGTEANACFEAAKSKEAERMRHVGRPDDWTGSALSQDISKCWAVFDRRIRMP